MFANERSQTRRRLARNGADHGAAAQAVAEQRKNRRRHGRSRLPGRDQPYPLEAGGRVVDERAFDERTRIDRIKGRSNDVGKIASEGRGLRQ